MSVVRKLSPMRNDFNALVVQLVKCFPFANAAVWCCWWLEVFGAVTKSLFSGTSLVLA